MKMKVLLIGIVMSFILIIGFASAQLNQNGQNDTSLVDEQEINQCDGLENCERKCNSNCTGECNGSCNHIEQRNDNGGFGPRDDTGNKGRGPCDGTGYGSKNCHK